MQEATTAESAPASPADTLTHVVVKHLPRPGLPKAGDRTKNGRRIASDAQIDAILKESKGDLSTEDVLFLLHRQKLAAGSVRIGQRRQAIWPGRKFPRGKAATALTAAAMKRMTEKPKALTAKRSHHPAARLVLAKPNGVPTDPLQPVAEAIKATMVSLSISSLTAKITTDGRLEFYADCVRRLEV